MSSAVINIPRQRDCVLRSSVPWQILGDGRQIIRADPPAVFALGSVSNTLGTHNSVV